MTVNSREMDFYAKDVADIMKVIDVNTWSFMGKSFEQLVDEQIKKHIVSNRKISLGDEEDIAF